MAVLGPPSCLGRSGRAACCLVFRGSKRNMPAGTMAPDHVPRQRQPRRRLTRRLFRKRVQCRLRWWPL